MPKKKIIRAEDITEKDILSLTEHILQLIFTNPEGINPIKALWERLNQFVQFDFIHYTMENPANSLEGKRLLNNFSFFENKKEYRIVPIASEKTDDIFDELVKANYQKIVELKRAEFPGKDEYHYYKLESRDKPKIVMGLFRFSDVKLKNDYTSEEVRILKKLTPHVLFILRIILLDIVKSGAFQYYDTFAGICTGIAKEFGLSNSETKLLPEILFGKSNEEIAKENFVTVAAVKKTVKHIFKKTSTKNRIDFISKFFTSPDRINI